MRATLTSREPLQLIDGIGLQCAFIWGPLIMVRARCDILFRQMRKLSRFHHVGRIHSLIAIGGEHHGSRTVRSGGVTAT
jgi:hypothetical protein